MASVAWDVVAAVKALLVALDLPGVGADGVLVRDEFVHDPMTERKRYLLVVGEDEADGGDEQTSGCVQYRYPVIVGVVLEREYRAEQAQWRKDTRQAVRRALNITRLPGVASTCGVTYEPRPQVDRTSWEGKFRVSPQRFVWLSDEQRNG